MTAYVGDVREGREATTAGEETNEVSLAFGNNGAGVARSGESTGLGVVW